MCAKLALTNVMKKIHRNLPPTFPESGNTLDCIVAIEAVVESVATLAAAPYIKDQLGDHRGLVLDMDVHKLLAIGNLDVDYNN